MDNPRQGKKEDPTAYKILGDLYFSEGQYEAAIKQYIQAVEVDPEYLEAWNQLHLSLSKVGRDDDAGTIQAKIRTLTHKTASNAAGSAQDSVSPEKGSKQSFAFNIPVKTVFKSKKFMGILSVIAIILCLGIIATFMMAPENQSAIPLPASRETILDISMIVSGWWAYNISGGHTYEIQLTADQPVTLFMCETYDYLQDGANQCQGQVQQTIAESTMSFNEDVVFPQEVKGIFLTAPNRDTSFTLKITKIS
jgi:tetratricopeptide (TPR) repeat protein